MIADLLKFVALTHAFQHIQRRNMVPGEDRQENDAEHSYQLASTGWYLVEHDKLPLNSFKVVTLALCHDLVEVHAGDTFLYAAEETRAPKDKLEKEALEQLRRDFPEFISMSDLIEEYKERKTAESRFVYALDKLLPIINNLAEDGRSWQKSGVTLEQVIATKREKIAVYPELSPYFEEIIGRMEAQPELFARKSA